MEAQPYMASVVPEQPPRKGPPMIDPKELVSSALNEQGFLLQQLVRKKLQGATDEQDRQTLWRFIATEYPVAAKDGSQTKIDILLRHISRSGVHMCLECKRPNPKYKKWIFFDTDLSVAGTADWALYFETITVTTNALGTVTNHDLCRIAKREVPVFNYYLEAGFKRDGSASSTEAIEKSFYQVTKANSGLALKIADGNVLGTARSIPVVVTTAELVEAKFDPRRISQDGTIEPKDLELIPHDYCAVTYRADDNLGLRRASNHERAVGTNDLVNRLLRTIFVVRVTALNRFLNWSGTYVTDFD